MSHRPAMAAVVAAVLKSSAATTLGDDDADLLKQAQKVFRPPPKDMVTSGLPVSKERAELGRHLFFEAQLTLDGNLRFSFVSGDVQSWPQPVS